MKKLIPCNKCRKNYILKLRKYPIEKYVYNKYILSSWLIYIHNLIRISQNKIPYDKQYIMNLYLNDYNLWFDIKYGICVKCSFDNNILEQMFNLALYKINEVENLGIR